MLRESLSQAGLHCGSFGLRQLSTSRRLPGLFNEVALLLTVAVGHRLVKAVDVKGQAADFDAPALNPVHHSCTITDGDRLPCMNAL